MCALDCLLHSCTCTFWLFGCVLHDHDVLIVAQQLGLLPFVSVAFVRELFLKVQRDKQQVHHAFLGETPLHS